MKTIDMYEVGEEVLIKATVTDIVVENGEIKYRIKAEHSNNDLDHKFTEHQLIPTTDVKETDSILTYANEWLDEYSES